MAGNELDVVAERPQALFDRAHQRVVVAAREVGAADRAGEKHVAHDGQLRRPVEEADMPRCVARCVQHFHDDIAETDRVAILEPAIGRKGGAVPGEAEHATLLG